MRKLTILFLVVMFLSFGGIMNAQDGKKEVKDSTKTEQVSKKVKKIKKSCESCPEKTKCGGEKKEQEKK